MIGARLAALARRLRPSKQAAGTGPGALRKRYDRPVATWVDSNYAPATCVMLTSLYLNSPFSDFDTWIFTGRGPSTAATPGFAVALDCLRARFGRKIELVDVDDGVLEQFALNEREELRYLNRATYGKLLLADLLSQDDFLYLDSDLVVQDDVAPLLSLDVEGVAVAGVVDRFCTDHWNDRQGVPAADPYINTGVMVVNAARWRKRAAFAEFQAWNARNAQSVVWLDQDILNACLEGEKLVLPSKWNTMQHELLIDGVLDGFDVESFRGCFHFTTAAKPWLPEGLAQSRPLYEKYARISPLRL